MYINSVMLYKDKREKTLSFYRGLKFVHKLCNTDNLSMNKEDLIKILNNKCMFYSKNTIKYILYIINKFRSEFNRITIEELTHTNTTSINYIDFNILSDIYKWAQLTFHYDDYQKTKINVALAILLTIATNLRISEILQLNTINFEYVLSYRPVPIRIKKRLTSTVISFNKTIIDMKRLYWKLEEEQQFNDIKVKLMKNEPQPLIIVTAKCINEHIKLMYIKKLKLKLNIRNQTDQNIRNNNNLNENISDNNNITNTQNDNNNVADNNNVDMDDSVVENNDVIDNNDVDMDNDVVENNDVVVNNNIVDNNVTENNVQTSTSHQSDIQTTNIDDILDPKKPGYKTKKLGLHAFRIFNTTHLLKLFPPEVVSAFNRHRHINTTLQYYNREDLL